MQSTDGVSSAHSCQILILSDAVVHVTAVHVVALAHGGRLDCIEHSHRSHKRSSHTWMEKGRQLQPNAGTDAAGLAVSTVLGRELVAHALAQQKLQEGEARGRGQTGVSLNGCVAW